MVIKRGDIWLTNFNPSFGTELHKKRPSIIISAKEINQYHPRVIVIPVSTKNYSGPSIVKIVPDGSGLDKGSFALPSEIRAIDKTRLVEKIGRLSRTKIKDIEEALKLVLGMVQI